MSFFFFADPAGAADADAAADGFALAIALAEGAADPIIAVDGVGAADALAAAEGFALAAVSVVGVLVVGLAELLDEVEGPDPLPSQAAQAKTARMATTEKMRIRFSLPSQT